MRFVAVVSRLYPVAGERPGGALLALDGSLRLGADSDLSPRFVVCRDQSISLLVIWP
jgi:hypothetical protein